MIRKSERFNTKSNFQSELIQNTDKHYKEPDYDMSSVGLNKSHFSKKSDLNLEQQDTVDVVIMAVKNGKDFLTPIRLSNLE